MNFPWPRIWSIACPTFPAGSSATKAMPHTRSASSSGTRAQGRRSRPRATKRPSPARAGSTTIATASSACGRASRNGAPSQPATRKPPDPSWASSALPPPSTGSRKTSSYNRPDIAFIVVGQLTEGLQAARDLLVEGSDHRREKAVQVEEVALLVSEGGALVEQRVVEEGITAAVGLYIGTVRGPVSWLKAHQASF